MSLKKQLRIAMATAIMGLGLIIGGTFAYFNESEATNSKISSGTLDLGIYGTKSEGVLFEFDNKKPGDTFAYEFTLKNDGTLDIKDVILKSNYVIQDENGETKNGFDKQILIKTLKVDDVELISGQGLVTLDKLVQMTLVKDLKTNDEAVVYVNFEFINKGDQNQYQGNTLDLTWSFEAMQMD